MTNEHHEADPVPTAEEVAAILRLFRDESRDGHGTKDVDPLASRLERPTVRRDDNGSVRVLWPSASSKVDVYVWPDGSIDVNPLGSRGRPHVRIETDGAIEVLDETPSNPSSAAASDDAGTASAPASDSTDGHTKGGGHLTD